MNLIILKLKINRNIDKHNLLLAIYIINYIIQEMKLKSDVRVKAKKFDLEHNDISFLLTVPSVQP